MQGTPLNPTLNPITYDFLVSRMHPDITATATPTEITKHAETILSELQNVPDLAGHRYMQGADQYEVMFISRIVSHHHGNALYKQDNQIELDWECIKTWARKRQYAWVRCVQSDGRLMRAIRRCLESLIDSKAQQPERIPDICDQMLLNVRSIFGLEAARSLEAELTLYLKSFREKVFQEYWMQALAMQQNAPTGSCMINLDKFIECSATRKRIQASENGARSRFDDDLLNDYVEVFKESLEGLLPAVCPKLNTPDDIEQILGGCQSALEESNQKIWMYSIIEHLSTFVGQDVVTHAAYLRRLIGQLYKMVDPSTPCLNRRWYEWRMGVFYYWDHVFSDGDERMDWIAMLWKQYFLTGHVQELLSADKPGIELELYRKNEVLYEPLLHFGSVNNDIAYTAHHGPNTVIPPHILFGLFFKGLYSLTQGSPNGWVDYALDVCPSMRMQYGIPDADEGELLWDRLRSWLIDDLRPLDYDGVIDYDVVRRDLSKASGRHMQGSQFERLKPHIQSLRCLLRIYIGQADYRATEAKILSYIVAMQTNAWDPTEGEGLECIKQIERLTNDLHLGYVEKLKALARDAVYKRGLELGSLRIKQ